MENKNISLMIVGFISLIMAAVFISQAASQGATVTTLTQTTNEAVNIASAKLASNEINTSKTFTLTNAPTGWKSEYSDCNIDVLNYDNGTTSFTETTDYVVTTAGVLSLKNTVAMNGSLANTTYIDYKYCPDTYVTSSWGRTAINTTYGLYAVAALLIAVGMFFMVAKNSGVIDKL